jgi:hypothetical protein
MDHAGALGDTADDAGFATQLKADGNIFFTVSVVMMPSQA